VSEGDLKKVEQECLAQTGKNNILERLNKALREEMRLKEEDNAKLLSDNQKLRTALSGRADDKLDADNREKDMKAEMSRLDLAVKSAEENADELQRLLDEQREANTKISLELGTKEQEIESLKKAATPEQIGSAALLNQQSTIDTLRVDLKKIQSLPEYYLNTNGEVDSYGGKTLGNQVFGEDPPPIVVVKVGDVIKINALLAKNRIYKKILVKNFEIDANERFRDLPPQRLEDVVDDAAFKSQLFLNDPVQDLINAYSRRLAQSRVVNPGDTGLKNILSRLAASQLGTNHAVITFSQRDGTPYMGMVVSRLQAKQTQDGRRHLILDLQSEDAQRNVAYPLSTLGSHDRILKDGQFTLAVYDRDVMLRNEPAIPYSLSETGTRQGEGAVLDTVNGVRLYTTDVAASRSRLDMLVIPY